MNIIPVTLEGTHVRLELLSPAHHAQLCDAGLGEDWWEFTTSVMRTPDDMRIYIEAAVRWQSEGTALPFAIIEKDSGTAAGSTRFANIDKSNRRLEIGWTWIGKQWHCG